MTAAMFPESDKTNFVVAQDSDNDRWLYFSDPVKIFSSNRIEEVKSVLAEVEYQCRTKNRYAAGCLSYEASEAFDSAYRVKQSGTFPLVWFGIYDQVQEITFPDQDDRSYSNTGQQKNDTNTLDWKLLLDEKEYRRSVSQVKDYIHDGDSYQVNYTFRLRSDCTRGGWPLFVEMVHAQNLAGQRGYCTYLETPQWTVCSASPELLFHYDGGALKSMPMKGTAPRGLGYDDDMEMGRALQESGKNRAENIMITDMVRNDMGKIAEIGSVITKDILSLEKYPTFWTMTSTVEAQAPPNLLEIFSALFPAASITGAPKVRAMEIIDELENLPRHIYTGSVGFITPEDTAQFNVAIRTVLLDKQQQQAEFGVGGGIVWDSMIGDEFQECHTKAKVLTYSQPEFDLIETLKWEPENGYLYLHAHLQRLMNSASYFSWNIDSQKILQALQTSSDEFDRVSMRVRVQVSRKGKIKIEKNHFENLLHVDQNRPYHIRLADRPVNSKNYFLYHKTTNRTVYENAMAMAGQCDDVLLWNERNEITESCRANILIEKDGEWLTPPISSGLLNGIARQSYLDSSRAREALITVDSLQQADAIWLVNSIRDRWQVVLLKP